MTTRPADAPAPLRVAGYVRVSTDAQAKQETHEVQIAWLEETASARGWRLLKFVEPGISGETLAARPRMRELLEGVRAGRFDAVAAKRVDRLCRSQDLTDWAVIADACKAAGVRVIYAGGEFDLRDGTQAFMFTVLGPGVAGFEKWLIASRTREGQRRAVKEGRKPHGVDPLGLRYVVGERRFLVVEDEAATIRRAYELAAAGLASRRVADRLRAEGHLSRGGMPITAGRVWKILRNPVYRGEWRFKLGSVPVPAIITAALWERVQGRLGAARRERGGRPESEEVNEFRGIAWCGRCGLRVHAANTGRSRTPYLICGSVHPHYREKGLGDCRATWRRDDVRGRVWPEVVKLLSSEEFRERVARQTEEQADPAADLGAERARLEARVRDLDAKAQGLTMRWARGLIAGPAYDRSLEAIQGDRALAVARLEELRDEEDRARAPAAGSLALALGAFAGKLQRASPKQRQQVLRLLCPTYGTHGLRLWPENRFELRGIVPVGSAEVHPPRAGEEQFRSAPFVLSGQLEGKRPWRRRA